jgi:hypothetical protein
MKTKKEKRELNILKEKVIDTGKYDKYSEIKVFQKKN